MRSNNAAYLVFAVVTCGCATRGPLVSVDVDALARAEPPAVQSSETPSFVASGPVEAHGTVFGLQDSPAVRGALGRDVQDAKEAIERLLLQIAPERGRLLTGIALRVAFPVPAPAVWPPVPADSPWRQRKRA